MTLTSLRSVARPAVGLVALAAAVVISSSNAFAAVGDIAPTVTTQPADQVVAAGADATFTSAASATPAATVQWQVSTGGGVFSDVAGAISLTFTVANTTLAMSGNAYRAVFTNSAGSATSNAASPLTNETNLKFDTNSFVQCNLALTPPHPFPNRPAN